MTAADQQAYLEYLTKGAQSSTTTLNGEYFYSLREVQIVIEEWRVEHTGRPHSSLGYRPPTPVACNTSGFGTLLIVFRIRETIW